MDDEPDIRIDHPEMLCNAIIGIIEDLEEKDIIEDERASKLRSEIHRSINIPEEFSKDLPDE